MKIDNHSVNDIIKQVRTLERNQDVDITDDLMKKTLDMCLYHIWAKLKEVNDYIKPYAKGEKDERLDR